VGSVHHRWLKISVVGPEPELLALSVLEPEFITDSVAPSEPDLYPDPKLKWNKTAKKSQIYRQIFWGKC
jgi:hypothetical protein